MINFYLTVFLNVFIVFPWLIYLFLKIKTDEKERKKEKRI